jgi:hypothetical protein
VLFHLRFSDSRTKSFVVEDPTNSLGLDDEVNLNTAQKCSECWTQSDLEIYPEWPGNAVYTEKEIEGMVKTKPFELKYPEMVCRLNCTDGYWGNLESTRKAAVDSNDQRCSYDNCKDWDFAGGILSAKECTTCWEEQD